MLRPSHASTLRPKPGPRKSLCGAYNVCPIKRAAFGNGLEPGRAGVMKDLDQFYTCPDLAKAYIDQVLNRWKDPDVLFVEPSAGTGAFLQPLLDASRKVRAIDLAPWHKGIVRSDFFSDASIFAGQHSAIVVVGNPPFGKNACQAVRFFNHAALHANEIAFIVPRTFRKISLQKRLDSHFHLLNDNDVQSHAFLRSGKPHDVPCAWQIWTRKDRKRVVPKPPSVDHLIAYTNPNQASFAMRRVGFYAGRVRTDNIPSLSLTTHYFMREVRNGVRDVMQHIDWTDLARQTVGSRSVSKTEIAFKLDEVFNA